MSLRNILWIALAVFAGSVVWHNRQAPWVRSVFEGTQSPPKPIQFDNGTVRQYKPAAAADAKAPKPGAMRKCRKGAEVMYTDAECPAGFSLQDLSGGTVNVVASSGASKPAAETGQVGGKAALNKALGVGGEDKLREKMMDSAIDAQSR